MSSNYQILPELFLRSPFYRSAVFDPSALPDRLADVDFRNAIWLASPAFYGQLKVKGFDVAALSGRERTTLMNYYNRMCFRPTPFGTFATFGLGHWGAGPSADPEAYLTLVPDRQCSENAFGPPGSLTPDTLLRKNPTIYRVGDHYRSIYTAPSPRRKYEFKIAQDDADSINNDLLRFLGNATRTAEAVAARLAARTGSTEAEAYEYLRFLVEDQFLYTPAQGHIIDHQDAEQARDWADWTRRPLTGIGELHRSLTPGDADRQSGPRAAYCYGALERAGQEAMPGEEQQEELLAAVSFLQRCARPAMPGALKSFIRDFQARFDLEEVPLLLALDPDTGISYEERVGDAEAEGLLDDLRFPKAAEVKERGEDPLIRAILLRQWLKADGRAPGAPIALSASDAAELPEPPRSAPSLAVMFRMTGAGLLLEQVAGISATQLLGRFSLFSPDVHQLCRKVAAIEAGTEAQVRFADIGQQSHSHSDNINRRKPIYELEIPVNVFSQADQAGQVALSDLRLSVRNGELLLRSAASGHRIIPRLASAYNYRHNELPLFRLLGDLQFQGIAADLSVDPVRLFPGLDHYPRITYERTIISPARWVLPAGEFGALLSSPGELDRYRLDKGIPALIIIGEQDQQLVFDLSDARQLPLLRANIREGDAPVIFQEYLAAPGEFAEQYIALATASGPVYPGLKPSGRSKAKVSRRFIPGEDWLYLKYYCTPATADRLLTEVVAPVIRSHRKRLAGWFFIRYQDPGYHLRVRVRAKDGDPGRLLSAFAGRFKRSGLEPLVSKVVCDTYERELERYGAGHIYPAEGIFEAGSELCLRTLADGRDEFDTGILTAWHMIRSYFPVAEESYRFVERMAADQFKSFKGDKALKVSLDLKFRSLRRQLESGLGFAVPEALGPLLARLGTLSGQMSGELPVTRHRMLADLVHMQMNRSFRQHQLKKELVVYHCLYRYFKALRGQAGKGTDLMATAADQQ